MSSVNFDFLNLPTPTNQKTFSEFVTEVSSLNRTKREQIAMKYILDGNVPDHMRKLSFLAMIFNDKKDDIRSIQIFISPDVLSIGTNSDHGRIPLDPLISQKICNELDCMLPTTKIADIIWKSSSKLKPQPWGPPYDSSMYSMSRIIQQNSKVNAQILQKKIDISTEVIAGHHKDVVITQRLIKQTNQVAIYGWHESTGKPIQPLSLVHENTYSDYSHGSRLIFKTCILDGKETKLQDVLSDPNLCSNFSSEGPMSVFTYPV